MTRDGLIEENLRDGSIKDISHRSRGRPENKEEFVPERERKKAENEDTKSGKGKLYSIRITVNSIRNDGTTRKDPGNGGKPRKIKGFSELMKRGGTRIDTFFEKRAHFSEQKEKLSTLSTKRAGKPHKQRVPGSFLNWNE